MRSGSRWTSGCCWLRWHRARGTIHKSLDRFAPKHFGTFPLLTTNTIQTRRRADGVPQYPETGMQRKDTLDNWNLSPGGSGYDFDAERKRVRLTTSARDTRLSAAHQSLGCRRLKYPPIVQKELFFQVWRYPSCSFEKMKMLCRNRNPAFAGNRWHSSDYR